MKLKAKTRTGLVGRHEPGGRQRSAHRRSPGARPMASVRTAAWIHGIPPRWLTIRMSCANNRAARRVGSGPDASGVHRAEAFCFLTEILLTAAEKGDDAT